MKVVPFALPDIGQAEIDGVVECLSSGWLTSGKKVLEFERDFAYVVEAKHAISVNSATTAALLLMEALNIGPGDEVIVPAYTFSGPAMMAHKRGATIIMADCLPDSYNLSPLHVEKLITSRTKLVMPTHIAGQACDMSALAYICGQHGVHLIDDAAHAFPTLDASTQSIVGGCRVAYATFFSFYATKTITTGEGGMITTNSDGLADKLKKLRTHGFSREIFDRYSNPATGWRYDIAAPGWKANMTDIAAAIGLGQLHRAYKMRNKRRDIALHYIEHFNELTASCRLTLPEYNHMSAWHLFQVQVPDRDAFMAHMLSRGVQCSVHFIPLHHHSEWKRILAAQGSPTPELPNADRLFAGEVSLPIYSKMSDADLEQVVLAVQSAFEKGGPCSPV